MTNSSRSTAVAGFSLIAAAVLFMGVFSYLASVFGYPDVLDLPAADVLPKLLALGTAGRAAWFLYALVPLLLVPAAVGTHAALRDTSPGAARAAAIFAVLSGLTMQLGLARWPTFQWELARAWATASGPERETIAAVFAGLNSYLGNFLGEFVGELTLNLYFVLVAGAMLRTPGFPRWAGFAGYVAGGFGFVAMFRNVPAVAGAVAPFAGINNAVLPLWLIALGVVFVRFRPAPGRN
ncbi:MAG: DUF4386 domain-containing protein [Acidobacteria bacterium]|nr:DUF4386 domain-containing protein [Acidobacteriota bacterium]